MGHILQVDEDQEQKARQIQEVDQKERLWHCEDAEVDKKRNAQI